MTLRPVTSNIALRKALLADYEFARHVHHRAMRPYVERLYGWDDADQANRFRDKFSLEGAHVIVRDRLDCGWLQIFDGEEGVYLRQIFILPEHQNQGIGTAILTWLIAGWRASGKAAGLGVMKNNPARRLYERLGFEVVNEDEHRLELRLA